MQIDTPELATLYELRWRRNFFPEKKGLKKTEFGIQTIVGRTVKKGKRKVRGRSNL
jgi:hypothetical protein